VALTILDLVTHLRRNVLHDIGGTGVDWAALQDSDYDSIQLRWSNEELVSNINEAIRVAGRRVNPIKDIVKLNVRSGKNLYSLDSNIIKVISARRSDGLSLTEKSLDDYFDNDSFDTVEGDIESFITDDTQSLRVYKTPSEDDYLMLKVYRLPKHDYTWANQYDSIEFKEEYQIPLLNYALYLCYMKDEANTYDPNRAASFLTAFNREFPETSVYSNIRKGRTSNRPVRYGGL
jgi:hypothetical protein